MIKVLYFLGMSHLLQSWLFLLLSQSTDLPCLFLQTGESLAKQSCSNEEICWDFHQPIIKVIIFWIAFQANHIELLVDWDIALMVQFKFKMLPTELKFTFHPLKSMRLKWQRIPVLYVELNQSPMPGWEISSMEVGQKFFTAGKFGRFRIVIFAFQMIWQ